MSDKYSDVSLDWCGEILAQVGYGLQARRILRPLIDGGARVKLIQEEDYIPEDRRIKDPYWISQIERSKEMEDTGIRINYCLPNLAQRAESGINIYYAMWETSAYPREWVGIINSQADRFFVGAEALVDSAKRGGVTVPVDVLTSSLDVDFWHPDGPVMDIAGVAPDKMVFLYVGNFLARKNFVDVLTAFVCEFDGHEDVALVLKVWGGDNGMGFRTHVQNVFRQHLDNLKHVTRPQISLVVDMIEEEQMVQMMRRAQVYTSSSHGEGFDLPLMQAMSVGCVPVVNDFLAHGDYCTDQNSILYNYFLKPCYGAEVPFYDAYQMWSSPDVGDYMQKLRHAYNLHRDADKQDQLAQLKYNARRTIVDKYSPEVIADHLAGLIKKIREPELIGV